MNASRFYTLSFVVFLSDRTKKNTAEMFCFLLVPISRIRFVLKADLFFSYSFPLSEHVRKLCFSGLWYLPNQLIMALAFP